MVLLPAQRSLPPSAYKSREWVKQFCRGKDLLKRKLDAPREEKDVVPEDHRSSGFMGPWGEGPLPSLSPFLPESMLMWVPHCT